MIKTRLGSYTYKGYVIKRTFDFLNPNCPTMDVKYYTLSRKAGRSLRADTLNGMKLLINNEVKNEN